MPAATRVTEFSLPSFGPRRRRESSFDFDARTRDVIAAGRTLDASDAAFDPLIVSCAVVTDVRFWKPFHNGGALPLFSTSPTPRYS